MILKKVNFPIFYFSLIICFFASCESNTKNDLDYLSHYNAAENNYKKAAYDSAFYHFEKLKTYCASKNDLDNMIYPILMMSEIQRIKNDFSGSEETVTEALKLIKKDTKKSYYTFIYNNLGLVYLEQANYTEAKKYYEKSLAITSDELSKCIIKNNIAYNYIKQKKYAQAKVILENIKNKDSLKVEPTEFARVLDNLGYTLYQLNEPNAITYLNQSKQIREKNKDSIGLTSSYIHLAAYHQNKNSSLAKKYASQAFRTGCATNSPDDKIEALQFLTKLSNGAESKQFALQSFLLNDSIKISRQQAKNQFAKIKYDSEKATEESQKQKKLKEYYLMSCGVLIGLGLFSFYKIRKKNRKKIKETAYNTETRIAKKLHDELANDVHNAIAFAETQNLENTLNKDTLLENLETIYNRTRNISNENKAIDTSENYLDKLKAMLGTYNSSERNVIINTTGFNHLKTSSEIKIIIYRVLQEFMVNMKKHSQSTLVTISIKSYKNELQINYSDNGIGCNNLLQLKNGLQNAENRIHSIFGTINFDTESGKGFKIKIMIPK